MSCVGLKKGFRALLILAASAMGHVALASSDPDEMVFSVHQSCNEDGRCTDVMMAEGYIDAGADERFREFILPFASVTMICLDSPGGDVGSAIRIAADIRLLGLSTCSFEEYRWPRIRAKSARCYSACSIIFMGGVHRVSGGDTKTPIGIHELQFSSKAAQEMSVDRIYQNLAFFLEQLDVNPDLLRLAAQVPAADIYLLSIEEARLFRVLTDVASPHMNSSGLQ